MLINKSYTKRQALVLREEFPGTLLPFFITSKSTIVQMFSILTWTNDQHEQIESKWTQKPHWKFRYTKESIYETIDVLTKT